jgi:hypothetical protein
MKHLNSANLSDETSLPGCKEKKAGSFRHFLPVFLLILILFTAPIVFGVLPEPVQVYKLDGNFSDYLGVYNGTEVGSMTPKTTGCINGSCYYAGGKGSGDCIKIPLADSTTQAESNFTWSWWHNNSYGTCSASGDSPNCYQAAMIGGTPSTGGNDWRLLDLSRWANPDTTNVRFGNAGAYSGGGFQTTYNSSMIHHVLRYNGANNTWDYWVDGIRRANNTLDGLTDYDYIGLGCGVTPSTGIPLGGDWLAAGDLDELYIFDDSLDMSEILELRYTFYPFSSPTPPVPDPVRTFSVTLTSNTSSYSNMNISDDPIQISYSASKNYTIAIPDVIGYWNMDVESATNTSDYYGESNGTIIGATWTADGKFGGAYNFDGDYINITYSTKLKEMPIFTINAWVKTNNYTGTEPVIAHAQTTTNYRWMMYRHSVKYMYYGVGNTTGIVQKNGNIIIPDNTWAMVTLVFNGTHFIGYVNATQDIQPQYVQGELKNLSNIIAIGRFGNFANHWNGSIDDVRIYNRSLSAQEIAFLYQSTYPKYNCSVSLDGVVVNRTEYQNITANTQSIYIDTEGFEESYDIQLACYDGFSTIGTLTNNATEVFIDTIEPNINSLTIPNNSVLFKHINTLNLTIRANDLNLYAVNTTIYKLNPDGSRNRSMAQHFNSSVNTTDIYYWNYSTDIWNNASWTSQRYEIELMAWDSHTTKAIEPYVQKEISGGKDIEGVKITSPLMDSFKTTKEIDRYSFDMSFTADNPEVYVECINPQILPFSEYKGHIVCFEEGKWIDFEEYSTTPRLTKIDDRTIMVVLENVKAEEIKSFNSIGDLNTNIKSLYFNVSDPFIFRAQDHFSDAFIANFTITLWDGAVLQHNKTADGYNVSFNLTSGTFSANITAPLYAHNETNITLTPGGNFTFDMYASESLYLLFFEEITDQSMAGTNLSISIINYDNSSTNTTTDDGFVFISGFAPGNYEIRYAAAGYNQRSYFTTISGSSTQQIELYLLSSTDGTYTNFIIEDETGNLLEGARLKAYRHFTDCNCFKIVEMDNSNFNGVGTLTLQHYDGKYKFIVEYNGATIYSSPALEGYRITEDAYSLAGSLLGDTYQSYYGTAGLYTALNYSNSTKMFYFTINDPTLLVNQFCLYVDEMDNLNANGSIRICENCLNASTGTLTCNISSRISSGHQFIGKGWVHTNTEYSFYWTDVLEVITDLTGIDTLGKTGVFFGTLLTLTIGFAGMAIAGIHAGVIGVLLGLGISMGTGLIAIGLPTFMGLVVIGIILMVLSGGQK